MGVARFGRDDEDVSSNLQTKRYDAPPGYESLWPTPEAGDGRVKSNNRRTGAQQGKASLKRKASCQQCGFLTDLVRDSHDGGSIDGRGAGGDVAKKANIITIASTGTTYTEQTGDQAHRRGAGCPFCFSRNSSDDVQGPEILQPQDVRLTGF